MISGHNFSENIVELEVYNTICHTINEVEEVGGAWSCNKVAKALQSFIFDPTKDIVSIAEDKNEGAVGLLSLPAGKYELKLLIECDTQSIGEIIFDGALKFGIA